MARDDLAAALGVGLLASLFYHEHKPKKNWKKIISTVAGLLALTFFVVVIIVHQIIHSMAIQKTKDDLSALANAVANNNRPVLMSWASGHIKDQWGETFVIENNTTAVCFLSKGPDKLLNTSDDIVGKSFDKQPVKYDVVIVDEKPAKKSIISSIYDKYKSWKDGK